MSTVCSSDDANLSYVKFMETFQELHDECIPTKRIKDCRMGRSDIKVSLWYMSL